MRKTLLVTNDFPPRPGGIQSYLHRFLQELPSEDIGVYCSTWKPRRPSSSTVSDYEQRCREFDAAQPYPIIRNPTSMLLPTPKVKAEVAQIIREGEYEAVWFGAAAPLALMSHYLRAHTPVKTIIASTHGHEVGWAMLPGAHAALRRIGNGCDVITYVSHYTRRRLHRALGPHCTMEWLPSGVDTERFHPNSDLRTELRRRHGIADDTPLVACISRLVPRKGQDMLIKIWPDIIARHPRAHLIIVGGGPSTDKLHRMVQARHLEDSVTFTRIVPEEDLPGYYAAADIFAMPCRTRGNGLDVEGLGIVFLEASATGIPVLVGDSGGAPETVLDGTTGVVVDGHDPTLVREGLLRILAHPQWAHSLGTHGRQWMIDQWQWSVLGDKLRHLLNDTGNNVGV